MSDENVAVEIEAEEVAEGLDGDDGTGDRIIFVNHLPQEDLQGFPGAAAEIGEKPPVIQKVTLWMPCGLRNPPSVRGPVILLQRKW